MDKIDNYMSAIEDVLAKQSESECRKNVFETLDFLIAKCPSQKERIINSFKEFVLDNGSNVAKLSKKYKKEVEKICGKK